MADITNEFNVRMPSGVSRKSDGDDLMRQHWRSLSSTISTEHHFLDSTKSAGIHRKGSARVFVQTSPPSGSADRDGRLWLDSAKSRLWSLRTGSTKSHLLGGAANEDAIHFSFDSHISPSVKAQRVIVSFSTGGTNKLPNKRSAGNKPIYYGIVFDEIPTITITPELFTPTQPLSAFASKPTTSTFSAVVWDTALDAEASSGTVNITLDGFVSNFS